jgi:uncharacterized caspase-like protein
LSTVFLRCRFVIAACLCFIFSFDSADAKRVALVVGISDYAYSPLLINPTRDAAGVSRSLRDSGFEVVQVLDGNRADLTGALERFYELADDAEAALFFFAGHGLQFEGVNYILPRDAAPKNSTRLKQETIALQDVISAMEQRAHVTLVFLDACRDNPFAEQLQRSLRGADRSAVAPQGLAPMQIRNPDTLLVFAAAPGRTASDGAGGNSPFTTALLKNMTVPNVEIELMLKGVTRDVSQATKGEQVPERLSRLTSDFYLRGGQMPTAGVKSAAGTEPPPLPPRDGCTAANKPVSCLWGNAK